MVADLIRVDLAEQPQQRTSIASSESGVRARNDVLHQPVAIPDVEAEFGGVTQPVGLRAQARVADQASGGDHHRGARQLGVERGMRKIPGADLFDLVANLLPRGEVEVAGLGLQRVLAGPALLVATGDEISPEL